MIHKKVKQEIVFNIYICCQIFLQNDHHLLFIILRIVRIANQKLGGGFIFFNFHPYLGKIPILTNIVQRG